MPPVASSSKQARNVSSYRALPSCSVCSGKILTIAIRSFTFCYPGRWLRSRSKADPIQGALCQGLYVNQPWIYQVYPSLTNIQSFLPSIPSSAHDDVRLWRRSQPPSSKHRPNGILGHFLSPLSDSLYPSRSNSFPNIKILSIPNSNQTSSR